MSVFSDNSDNPASLLFSNDTINFSIEADITDQFTITNGNNTQTFSTGNIGQTTFENGTAIPSAFLSTNGSSTSTKTLLVSGQESLVSPTNVSGYIIDQIQINSAFKGDISIEFLDSNNEVVWSGVYQSQGKWSNSIREIWTLINTSVLNKENMYYTDQLPYPKALPEPATEGLVIQEMVNNFTNTMSYSVNANFNNSKTITCGTKKATIPYLTIGSIGISNSSSQSIPLFGNYYWNTTNLQANWKGIELTFTDNNSNTYTTTIPFSNIPGLGLPTTNNNPQYSLTLEITDIQPFIGYRYQCYASGGSGSQGRPNYSWRTIEVSTNIKLSMNLSLKFLVTWDQTNTQFVLRQTVGDGNVGSSTVVLTNNASLTNVKPNDNYTLNANFSLTTAKLLLK